MILIDDLTCSAHQVYFTCKPIEGNSGEKKVCLHHIPCTTIVSFSIILKEICRTIIHISLLRF